MVKKIAIWILNIIGLAFLFYWLYYNSTFVIRNLNDDALERAPFIAKAWPELAYKIKVLPYLNLSNLVLEIIGVAYEYYLLHNRRFFGAILGALAFINVWVVEFTRGRVIDHFELSWLIIPDVVWLAFTVVFVLGIILVKRRIRKKAELHCKIEP
ncbi:hypothetical protein II898_01340 [bacterium]|nr:hypothetical protein [bacterium]MBR0192549.1 hypothetical protein [Thermoguttaceae bacterium]